MLTVFALTPLLTLLWWSLWSMADLKLFPNDHVLSYVTCMSIGGGLSLIYLSVQRPLHRCLQILPDEFTESWRFRILVSTFKAVQAIASFLIWRALWSCMKDYVLLGQYMLELSVLWHFLGITLLVLTQTASSLSVPGGFAIDGEGGPAISMDCQISYFQEWLACKVEPSHVNSQEYGENNFDSESSPLITATS
ncbi:hypothetical protein CAPTEDRAFT_216363 [Capitella teleta]|uniref:Uncharacterized protein n=1 Tax=Capitella teleta TaxID=283909 RepID=R7TQ57_CAPTE|nr:hypothetical protein CAPTEDRAFT_216363 [Capitella teleta]|eukprot:ELT93646.1 hypothetical protein CAPTEDRAFT_216363 [Capitella teleta]